MERSATDGGAPALAQGGMDATRRRWLLAGLGGGLVAALPGLAWADEVSEFPRRPVRLVVSYAAGNVTDILARLVAEGLAAKWGQPVTVENRPGQGGSVGAQSIVRAPADGYTLLFSAMAAMAINPHVYTRVGYDPLRDFLPIVNVASPDAGLLVAAPQLGVKTWAQLLEHSGKNPGSLNYGTAGNGTVPHLNMEAIKQRTGLQAQHVPYNGAAAVLNDLIGGRIHLQSESAAVLLPHVKNGKVVALAATGKRLPELPDLPALSELIPGFEAVVPWLGILAPAGTPAGIVTRVHRDVRELLAQPALRTRLAGYGLTVAEGSPQDFAVQLRKDHERLGKLTQQIGLKLD